MCGCLTYNDLPLPSKPLDGDDKGLLSSAETTMFTTAKWPVTHEETRVELEQIAATHRIVPIPAYDIKGDLIKPEAYRRSLEDAIVELHFGLTHWAIAGRKAAPASDVFVGDIDLIRVLVPPHTSSSGMVKKRVVPMYMDPNAPVSKKARMG